MFTRYKSGEKGQRQVVCKVYTSREHNIRNSQIDKDCLWAIRKLWGAGHKAYIVGGAVRDLILGKRPKDFDIATSASPRQVQNIFWNSRAIGKRFRIVHLYFANKIIEVTTFRSDEENFEEGNNNIFGTIEQDSHRRDFSINALYYNPLDGHLLDFNDSMEDMKRHVIRSLIPLSYTFKEDPVRMVRAIKYASTTGFRLKWDVRWAIRRDSSLIQKVSLSRLTDEVVKILNSGSAHDILLSLHRYGLLAYVMPSYDMYLKYESVREALCRLDRDVATAKAAGNALELSQLIATIASPLIVLEGKDELSSEELRHEVFREIKVFVAPMTPPNYEIDRAVEIILLSHGVKVAPQRRRNAGRKGAPAAAQNAGKPRRSATGPSKPRRRRRGGATKPTSPQTPAQPASSAEAHDL